MKILKKISMRTIGISRTDILDKVMKDKNSVHTLALVLGIAGGKKRHSRTNEHGELQEDFGFTGQFKATNLETGEEYTAAVCYLPGAAKDILDGVLSTTENVSGVEFIFKIQARYDEKSATSYVYEVETVVKQENAQLARLENLAKGDKNGK